MLKTHRRVEPVDDGHWRRAADYSRLLTSAQSSIKSKYLGKIEVSQAFGTVADDNTPEQRRHHDMHGAGHGGGQVDDGNQSRGSYGYQSSMAAYGDEAVEPDRRQGGGHKPYEPSIVARSRQRALYLLRKKQNSSYNFSS